MDYFVSILPSSVAYNSGSDHLLSATIYNSGSVGWCAGNNLYNIGEIDTLYRTAIYPLATTHNAGRIGLVQPTDPIAQDIINSWVNSPYRLINCDGGLVLAYDGSVLSVGMGEFTPEFKEPEDFESCVCASETADALIVTRCGCGRSAPCEAKAASATPTWRRRSSA
jgi:hypothetical protein